MARLFATMALSVFMVLSAVCTAARAAEPIRIAYSSVNPHALLVWIAPWILGQAFLRPYLLAEHTGCGATRDCLENTRTTLSVTLVRLFAWNMPYHAEHHAYPAIPFHALPRLHAILRCRIEHVEPGYVAATVTVNRYLFRQPAPASGRAKSAD